MWSAGPEVWEDHLDPQMRFETDINCSSTNEVVMQWEYVYVCTPGMTACVNKNVYFTHSGHDHISRLGVVFDASEYGSLLNDAWRSTVSAREWGHVLGLLDHPEQSNCSSTLLMSGIINDNQSTPCAVGPRPTEVCSVWTDVYGYSKNTDNEPIVTAGRPDDSTVAMSDDEQDGCESDDDNDGLLDLAETPGCNGSAALLIVGPDTDGDRIRDGAECALGSNPFNYNSRPAIPSVDADGDRLSDGFEFLFGWSPNNPDSDGDGINDGLEYMGYSTTPIDTNSDGDACPDDTEVASINGDTSVNVIDLSLVSGEAGVPGPANYDVTKNREVNVLDLQLIAANLANGCP